MNVRMKAWRIGASTAAYFHFQPPYPCTILACAGASAPPGPHVWLLGISCSTASRAFLDVAGDARVTRVSPVWLETPSRQTRAPKQSWPQSREPLDGKAAKRKPSKLSKQQEGKAVRWQKGRTAKRQNDKARNAKGSKRTQRPS